VYDEKGFTTEKLSMLKRIKNEERGRIEAYAKEAGLEYFPKCTPWHFKMDVALPCATQNELNIDDAQLLVQNGVQCVAEGANMPCSPAAIAVFENNGILFAPGKACNAGGVATSGLEMSQNAMRLSWTRDEVDTRLLEIMKGIHKACLRYGTRENGTINYVDGANIAGFVKVADAMLAQGII
jgi:glutamate dehydrogenase (NADP+)